MLEPPRKIIPRKIQIFISRRAQAEDESPVTISCPLLRYYWEDVCGTRVETRGLITGRHIHCRFWVDRRIG